MTDIADQLWTDRVLPVVVLHDAGRAEPLGAAVLAGGLRCVEVTFRTSAAEAAIEAMAANPDLIVGAGTVRTEEQVDRAADAGARFVVSPGFSAGVVKRCHERGLAVYPGIATATEILMALDAGIHHVKFFPAAQLGGPAMVKALAAPFPSVRFIPTGGVSSANLREYLTQDSVLAVGGTWMVATDLVRAEKWDEITALTAEAHAIAHSI
jgi:2-dehydro-3-deoxyphosphogluconate aldolase/(4S)-4-hydroxy-2-oxoglutarate aldolase